MDLMVTTACTQLVIRVTEMVKYYVEKCKIDPCVSARKEKRTNSLHIASQCGHEVVVEYLVYKSKMDPNFPDENGNTPLHLAVIHNQFQVVKSLVESQKCNVSVIPQSLLDQVKDSRIRDCIRKHVKLTLLTMTNPYLHLVTSGGDLKTLKSQSKTTLQFCTHTFDRRLIHVAAEFGHLRIIKFFVEEKIFEADLKDEFQFTPLHLTAGKGHVDIFKYLVQQCKCDPNCRVSKDYGDYRGGATPLLIAGEYGQLSMIKHILESHYGIDADVETYNGTTALQFAAMEGHLDIIRYLTKKHNCNATHRNEEMTTAMHLAVQNNHLDVVCYLREEMECDPAEYTSTLTGRSSIHIAAIIGSLDITKYLVSECGIDPNMPSTIASYYETPLHCAACILG